MNRHSSSNIFIMFLNEVFNLIFNFKKNYESSIVSFEHAHNPHKAKTFSLANFKSSKSNLTPYSILKFHSLIQFHLCLYVKHF